MLSRSKSSVRQPDYNVGVIDGIDDLQADTDNVSVAIQRTNKLVRRRARRDREAA